MGEKGVEITTIAGGMISRGNRALQMMEKKVEYGSS